MQLVSINYSEYESEPREWKLNDLTLGKINLIVGKNASGKTRALNVIKSLGVMLSGNLQSLYTSGTWCVRFESTESSGKYSGTAASERTTYEISFKNRQITHESLRAGRRVLMSRNEHGEGSIYAFGIRKKINFRVATNQLIAPNKRDALQHPYLQELYAWGTSISHYEFGTDFGKSTAAVFVKGTEPSESSPTNRDATLPVLQKALATYKDEFKQRVLADLSAIGYECTDIGLMPLEGIEISSGPAPVVMYVQERDLRCKTAQPSMSQGMYRAISVVVLLNAGILAGRFQTILIDDIGEGLDYARSMQLISLLVKKAQEESFQLILTTNDRFIMNAVPLEYWSVLHRESNEVKVFNFHNAKKQFTDFKFLGLNNFDFFTGQYFLEHKNNAKKNRRIR